jgi:exosortase E/protease (VPEID-CTERM system)
VEAVMQSTSSSEDKIAGAISRDPSRFGWRFVVFVALTVLEIGAVSYLFYFPVGAGEWANPVFYAKKGAQIGVVAAVAFCIIAWPRRQLILGSWDEFAQGQHWRLVVASNLIIFTLLVVATVTFSNYAATTRDPPWLWFVAFCALLLVNAGSLALVAAPWAFWTALPRLAATEVGLAAGGALLVLLAGELAKEGWAKLAAATLSVSAWILSLYESDVLVEPARKLLGVGDFRVIVTPECSGYEGIGLVTTFLCLYFVVFRAELRFPNALVLIPIGIGAIWILNALRIAVLVSIGAHYSPAVATDGFHSQAGWIAFVLVTLGLVAVAHRSAYIRVHAARERERTSNDRLLYALLLPFIALMASSVVAAAFAPNDQWLYALKVVAVGGVLLYFRDVYLELSRSISLLSVAAGLAVGIAWIITDPQRGETAALGVWLGALPPLLAALWLTLRALGSVVLVPLAEELAFRGYLHRVLIARRFETVPYGQFSWLALVVSTVAFGLVHQRWLAAMAAGAVYALLMYRSGRLSDPIAAHMASNAAIMFWAVAAGQWSLL